MLINYYNKLNKPDWRRKLSRSFIGKLGTESGAEITHIHCNLVFKLNDLVFWRKAGPLLLINSSPAIRFSPARAGAAAPIGFIKLLPLASKNG